MAGGMIATRGPIIRENGLMGRVTEHEMTDGRRDESHVVVKRGRETEGEDSPTRRDESYVVLKRTEEIERADGPTRRDESYALAAV